MMKRTVAFLIGFSFLGLSTLEAQQRWFDDFDSYSVGPWAPNGGWEEWCSSMDVNGEIVNHTRLSTPNSGFITGDDFVNPMGDDVVYDFANAQGGRPTTGQWIFSIDTFVPSGASGIGWIIMLNTYCPADSADWSAQLLFDMRGNPGQVLDRSGHGGQGTGRSIVRDRWVTVTVCVDLDSDRMDLFYDGLIVREGATWTGGDPTRRTIAALDLYANEPGPNAVTEWYFDNARLEQRNGRCVSLGISSNDLSAGDNVAIRTHAPTLPGAQAALFVWEVAGNPFISPVFTFPLDGSGFREITGVVPPGTPAVPVGFRALVGAPPPIGVQQSNLELVIFQ